MAILIKKHRLFTKALETRSITGITFLIKRKNKDITDRHTNQMVIFNAPTLITMRRDRPTCLVVLSFIILTLSRFSTDLLIILLEGSKILSGFRELSFLHTLTDIPVHKSTLSIHEIKLVDRKSVV